MADMQFALDERGGVIAIFTMALAVANIIAGGGAPEPWGSYIDSAERLLEQLERRYAPDPADTPADDE